MLDIDKHIISPLEQKPASQDYEKLRELGISHIQALGSKLWSDYNVHDPGVTILELLCYALTDLGYRTNFDIKDILTKEGKSGPEFSETFCSAKNILTCRSTTVNDYRKLILDSIPEIRNVWFIPLPEKIYEPNIYTGGDLSRLTFQNTGSDPLILNGLYLIKYELYEDEWYMEPEKGSVEKKVKFYSDPLLKKSFKPISDEIILLLNNEIKELYLDNRNLCEDMQCISPVEYEYVGICSDIELTRDADPVEVKKNIYRKVYEYISPQLQFYTFEQLLDKNNGSNEQLQDKDTNSGKPKTIEEIFQGSEARSGFIDYDELEKFQRKEVLYTSDIINVLMDIPGILDIRKLHLSSYKLLKDGSKINTEEPLVDGEEYCLHLVNKENAFKFRLDILEDSESRINKFKFFFDTLNIPVKIKEGKIRLEEIAPILKRPAEFLKPLQFLNDLPAPTGKYRELDKYYSIQNEFPAAYVLGKEGISDLASKNRKSQRLQLKGFLIFFEQLLADYLSQLNNASRLLSFSKDTDRQTYFFQELESDEIYDIEKLKTPGYGSLFHDTADPLKYQSEIIFKDKPGDKVFDRRNRFLNMLIARFNESFVEFSIDQFIRQSTKDVHTYEHQDIIDDKRAFLRAYPKLRKERFHAFNYSKEVWNTTNISGYEFVMLKEFGITNLYGSDPAPVPLPDPYPDPNEMLAHSLIHPVFTVSPVGEVNLVKPLTFYDNRQIRFDESFGFHVIEHILLRARWGSEEKFLNICEDKDSSIENCPCSDPYSFKMTAVMPGWLDISMNIGFRKYIETAMREELPAHISMKICWVSAEQMYLFEKAYFAFMDCLRIFSSQHACYNYKELKDRDQSKYTESLNNLVDVINDLNNIYPPSYLLNCNDIEVTNKEITKAPVILGRNALNSYKKNKWKWRFDKSLNGSVFLSLKQLEKEKVHFINSGPCGSKKAVVKVEKRKAPVILKGPKAKKPEVIDEVEEKKKPADKKDLKIKKSQVVIKAVKEKNPGVIKDSKKKNMKNLL